MRVAGLDIASRLTGWCVGDGTIIPRADAFRFPQFDEDLGRLLDAFDKSLEAMFSTYRPDAVVYEAPILIVNKKKRSAGDDDDGKGYTDKPLTLRKLYSMGAYLEFFCHRRSIECSEVTIQAIKSEVTGNRFADKKDLVAVAKACGLNLPTGPAEKDAADAWGAWLLGMRHYDPKVSREWDARVYRAAMKAHQSKGLFG